MTASPFTGTWQLQSWTAMKNDTPTGYPMGEDALGQIIYAEDGHMCAFLMRSDFAANDAPAEPETCLSYGGKWQFAEGKIAHQVDFSSLPHWVGRTLVRHVAADGTLMTLRTEVETSKSGARYEHILVWKRAAS